jgi:hypothetical protein
MLFLMTHRWFSISNVFTTESKYYMTSCLAMVFLLLTPIATWYSIFVLVQVVIGTRVIRAGAPLYLRGL